LTDVINIYEVNRKECARLLLDMPRWFAPGIFKPKPGIVVDSIEESSYDKAWQLESTIIEVSLIT
jgi:nuclear cap-binding protein subunit 1